MKLIQTYSLHSALSQIAKATEATPRDFPMIVRIAVAENLRLALPHASDYEKQRVELIKEHGKEDESNGNWKVLPEKLEEFAAEHKKLADIEVATQFRRLYENQLGNSPLTVDQLGILQEVGLLLPEEKPKPPLENK